MDRAGWHIAHRLVWPATITPLHLPPYSPELNPIKRVWLYLRERFLSHRVLDSYEVIALLEAPPSSLQRAPYQGKSVTFLIQYKALTPA